MKASTADNPGNVFSASQQVQRALQISRDAISNMTAEARSTGTVRTTAPHSLHVISA
jgi:DNA-binding transcriptional regulator LsrR (DeoR family)